MTIETKDPNGVKDASTLAPNNVVVSMRPGGRFRPRGVVTQGGGTARAQPTLAPTGAKVKHSLPYLFSEGVAKRGLNGSRLAVRDTGADSPCLVYSWASSHWTRVGDNVGSAAADTWLRKEAPDKLSPNKAKECWESTKLRLLSTHRFPEPSEREIRIPLRSHTLCVQADGSLMAVPPNPEFGLEHCLDIQADDLPPEGGAYSLRTVGHAGATPFSNWLRETLPDAGEQQVVQELCAQTLMPQAYSIAGWLVGEGGSGKSTVLEMLSLVHSSAVRMSLDKLDGEFALQPLLDASVVLVDEVKPKAIEEERLKTLISQNKVSIPRKHITSVGEFRPRAKWMICSNQMPLVRDLSEGLWRRLVFVHFRNVVPEAKRKSDLHLDFDLREVLDWMLAGVVRIAQRGRMQTNDEMPATCRAMKDGAKLASDNVLMWMEGDGVAFDSSPNPKWVTCQAIYERYVAYCNCIAEPVNPNAFWRTLKVRLLASGVELPQPSNRNVGGKPARCQPFLFGQQKPVVAAPPSPPPVKLEEWFDAAGRADETALKQMLGRGAPLDARMDGRSALGFVLESEAPTADVDQASATLLRAGAQVHRAGKLSGKAQAKLFEVLAVLGEEQERSDSDLATFADSVFGKTDSPFISIPVRSSGASS